MPRNSSRVLAEAIVSGEITDSNVISAIFDVSNAGDYCCSCAHCDEWAHSEDICYVDGDEAWCESCRDSDSYYWESDSEYHSEPEPEDEDDSGIPDYHDTEVVISAAILADPTVLGVELETYQPDCETAGEYFSELRSRTDCAFKFERDGSLDSQHGVELVFAPMPLAAIVADDGEWQKLLAFCKSQHAKAWDAGDGYGMHVSINGGKLSPAHRARIVRFFNSQVSLCERLAGRKESRWAKYSCKAKLSDESLPTDKYQAAANRGERIEVRIFRATLNFASFCRNCEFVDSVRVFCESCGFNRLSEVDFLNWLKKPENRAQYPQLSAEFWPARARKGAAA